MTSAALEHLNITVIDPDRSAALLAKIFDWQVRWSGTAMNEGRTVHVGSVGNGSSYLALYTRSGVKENFSRNEKTAANLNHIGVTVPDLDEIEQRVIAEGLTPVNYGDYEPGRRFYFYIDDGIEIEVVSYC